MSNYSFNGTDLLDYLYNDIFALAHNQEIQILPIFDKGTIESIDTLVFGTYQLDSTAQIRIQPFGNGLKIQTIGQEAINLFQLRENYIPGIYKDKNEIAFEAFQLAIENDDYSRFSKLIQDKERLTRIRKFLTSYIQNLQIEQPKVLPYITERNEDGLQSYIAISNGKGVLQKNRRYPFLSLVWTEEGNYRGMGTIIQTAKSPTYYFTKSTENNHFIGYNWDSRKIVNINISLSKETSDKIKIKIEENDELLIEKIK